MILSVANASIQNFYQANLTVNGQSPKHHLTSCLWSILDVRIYLVPVAPMRVLVLMLPQDYSKLRSPPYRETLRNVKPSLTTERNPELLFFFPLFLMTLRSPTFPSAAMGNEKSKMRIPLRGPSPSAKKKKADETARHALRISMRKSVIGTPYFPATGTAPADGKFSMIAYDCFLYFPASTMIHRRRACS